MRLLVPLVLFLALTSTMRVFREEGAMRLRSSFRQSAWVDDPAAAPPAAASAVAACLRVQLLEVWKHKSTEA